MHEKKWYETIMPGEMLFVLFYSFLNSYFLDMVVVHQNMARIIEERELSFSPQWYQAQLNIM